MKKPVRTRPFLCVYDGEHFIPLPRFKRMIDEQFSVHEEVPLIRHEERSMSSHRGYFAQLTEAFNNLAEEYANGFPSVEHLRSTALIETGYCTESTYVMDNEKEAKHLGVMLRRLSPYAIIRIRGNVVKHFEPESQAFASMPRARFEESKRAVLEYVTSLARTTPAELKKNAGGAA